MDYFMLPFTQGNFEVPASCSDIRSCSNIATDGEYWIYPMAANGKRTKIFCHDLANEPSHFITLSNINNFIQHDASNWIPLDRFQQCQANFKMPLKSVVFRKIRIGIEDMEVNGTDYTFTNISGSPTISYGEATDCNGQKIWNPCPHFGNATIDTRGTGLIIHPTIAFGVISGWDTEIRDFIRSADGSQIFFSCAGWCGWCGPISGPIGLQHSTEFISAIDAEPVICYK